MQLADAINDKRTTLLKRTLELYNNDARESESGQMDLFSGGVLRREDILKNVINFINENYGKRKEIEAARAEAVERRKAESVQQDGTPPAVNNGSEDTGRSERSEEEIARLTHDEAITLIAQMEERADVAPDVELAIENWDAQFGEDGRVNTPIGDVKMGENQFTKLMRQGREGKLGMIKPTLEPPDVIIEDASEAKEDDVAERNSSYVFVKAFKKADGSRYYYFTSVTVSKDGKEVVISNQEKRKNAIANLLTNGKLVWKHADDVSAASDVEQGLYSSQGNMSDPTTEGTDAPQTNDVSKVFTRPALEPDTNTDTSGVDSGQAEGVTTPAGNSPQTSAGKGSENSATVQEKGEKSAENQTPNAVQAALAAAEQETNIEPTEAQKKAGNYKKGHVKIDGYDVTIENPKGSVRRGSDASGKQWEQEMQNTYGYILGTEGVDGDHIDVFFSEDPSQGDVFVVDQVNKDGSFDEHKVMYGFPDIESARKAYLSNYEDGWQGLGAITPVSKEEFKKWIDSSHRKTKPFAEYKGVKTLEEAQHNVEGSTWRGRYDALLKEAMGELQAEMPEETITAEDAKAEIDFNDESDFYQEAENALGRERVDETAREIREKRKTDVQSELTIDNILNNHNGHWEHGDAVYNAFYFGFRLSENESKKGTYDLTVNTKWHNGTAYNPYYSQEFKGLSKEQAEAMMKDVADKEISRGGIVVPLSRFIQALEKHEVNSDVQSQKVQEETSEPANCRMDVESNLKGKSDDTATRQDSDVSTGKVSEFSSKKQEKGDKKSDKDKIEDVGERLEGARKDIRMRIAMDIANVTEAALIEKPFGKVYKKPDLKKAVESGALREKDAIFYDAMFFMVNQQKPKVTQSEMWTKRNTPRYNTKAERWAANTFKLMDALRMFLEADEAGRDAMMEFLLSDRYPTREQELAEIEKRKEWNPDRDGHKHEWGDKTTPNALWVNLEVLDRLGHNVGDRTDIPYGIIKANTSGTGYFVQNLKGERAYFFGNDMTLDEAIDTIVYLARLKRGDSDISHPTKCFAFPSTKSERGETGRYEVIYGRYKTYTTKEFGSKEQADAFAQTKQGAFVHPIEETTREYGYKVVFKNPLTNEKMYVGDAEFDTKAECEAYFDSNFDKINDAVNDALQAEREKKGEKKALTPDDVVYALRVHTEKSGWTYAVVLTKRFSGKQSIIKEGFPNMREAKAFANDIKGRLTEALLKHKEDLKKIVYFDTGENSRIGEDYRDDKDVGAEDFMDMFGFRGVQFGNWTNQADRQMALNQAYDAFLDMSKLIGVSPRAMSLNGELGIAFGSRGVGGASAHYETDEVVINLTKTRGAGNLAHEWWHAMDNYFARREGRPTGMVTEDRGISMREELRKAFDDMLDAVLKSDYVKRSAKRGDYWGREAEITARLLAEWVNKELKDRGELNTFLSRGANLESIKELNYGKYKIIEELAGRTPMSYEDYKDTPDALAGNPYPSEAEVEEFGGLLRHIFDTLEERTDEVTGRVALFHKLMQSLPDDVSLHEAMVVEAMAERLRAMGIETITDIEEAQRVLDEANGEVQLMGSRVEKRKADIAEKLKDTELSKEQQAVVDVFTGKKNNATISITEQGGQVRNVVMRQGNEQGAGTKHSIYRHYDTASNGYTADEILLIPDIIKNGKRKQDEGKGVSYSHEIDGVKYTVTTEIKGKAEQFTNFYTNKKPTIAEQGTQNTDEQRVQPQQSASGANVGNSSETSKENSISFSRVFGGNKGYVGYSKSKRAARAEDRGLRNKSQMNKDFADEVNALIQAQFPDAKVVTLKEIKEALTQIRADEWHHTSMYGNRTNYYSAERIAEHFMPESEEERALREKAAQQEVQRGTLKEEQSRLQEEIKGEVYEGVPYEFIDDPTGLIVGGKKVFRTSEGHLVEHTLDVLNPSKKIRLIPNGKTHFEGEYDYGGWVENNPEAYAQALAEYNEAKRAAYEQVSQEKKDRLKELEKALSNRPWFFRTRDGHAYGFTLHGKIYLDPRIATSETPLHEYTHLWSDALERANPEAWAHLKAELANDEELVSFVRSLYPEITDENTLMHEVFSHFSGKRGKERLDAARERELQDSKGVFDKARIVNMFERLKNLLSKYWTMARNLFAGNNSKLKEMSVHDFADMAMADFMRGFNPAEDGSVKTDVVSYHMGSGSETFKARQRQAVENNGTVMPGLNDAVVKVVDKIPRHTYTGNIAEATQQAIEAAKAKYVPNGEPKTLHYSNHGSKFDYSISSNAIEINLSPKHQAKSVNKGVHLALAEHIDEVITESIEVEEHPDYIKNENGIRDTKKTNDKALMHRFYGVAVIDGKTYRVMTLIREERNPAVGNGVHAYEVQKIEVLDETPNTSNGVGSHSQSKIGSSYPLANLLQNVEKAYDTGKKLLDESKKLDDALYRQGTGAYSNEELSMAHDPMSKMLGKG